MTYSYARLIEVYHWLEPIISHERACPTIEGAVLSGAFQFDRTRWSSGYIEEVLGYVSMARPVDFLTLGHGPEEIPGNFPELLRTAPVSHYRGSGFIDLAANLWVPHADIREWLIRQRHPVPPWIKPSELREWLAERYGQQKIRPKYKVLVREIAGAFEISFREAERRYKAATLADRPHRGRPPKKG